MISSMCFSISVGTFSAIGSFGLRHILQVQLVCFHSSYRRKKFDSLIGWSVMNPNFRLSIRQLREGFGQVFTADKCVPTDDQLVTPNFKCEVRTDRARVRLRDSHDAVV